MDAIGSVSSTQSMMAAYGAQATNSAQSVSQAQNASQAQKAGPLGITVAITTITESVSVSGDNSSSLVDALTKALSQNGIGVSSDSSDDDTTKALKQFMSAVLQAIVSMSSTSISVGYTNSGSQSGATDVSSLLRKLSTSLNSGDASLSSLNSAFQKLSSASGSQGSGSSLQSVLQSVVQSLNSSSASSLGSLVSTSA
jgi:hypothetical protein